MELRSEDKLQFTASPLISHLLYRTLQPEVSENSTFTALLCDTFAVTWHFRLSSKSVNQKESAFHLSYPVHVSSVFLATHTPPFHSTDRWNKQDAATGKSWRSLIKKNKQERTEYEGELSRINEMINHGSCRLHVTTPPPSTGGTELAHASSKYLQARNLLDKWPWHTINLIGNHSR